MDALQMPRMEEGGDGGASKEIYYMSRSAYKQLGFCHREIVLYVHWIDSWFLNEEGLVFLPLKSDF